MFLLKDLPTPATARRFAEEYGPIDIAALTLFLTALRCGSDLLTELDRLLARHGLSHGRWITLVLLMREPDRRARPKDLALKQGITRATMTGLLQSLEADGLVTRRAEPDDGRGSVVVLTRKGHGLLRKIMPDYYARVGRLSEGLSGRDVAAATKVLRALMQRAETLSGETRH